MNEDNVVQFPGTAAPPSTVDNTSEVKTPLTVEERLDAIELAYSKLSDDIGHDMAFLVQTLGEQKNTIVGVYNMCAGAQILAEALARYQAGYKVGQYAEDVSTAIDSNAPEKIKLKGQEGSGFDDEKFLALVKESAEAFVRLKEFQISQEKVKQGIKEGKIILPPEKKILMP
jgi:phosphoglycerate-specific signal transduction histidine kinase